MKINRAVMVGIRQVSNAEDSITKAETSCDGFAIAEGYHKNHRSIQLIFTWPCEESTQFLRSWRCIRCLLSVGEDNTHVELQVLQPAAEPRKTNLKGDSCLNLHLWRKRTGAVRCKVKLYAVHTSTRVCIGMFVSVFLPFTCVIPVSSVQNSDRTGCSWGWT